MIRHIDSSSETFLDSLGKISQRMERAQKQLATGLKFSTVSDDPDHVSALLQSRADLAAAQTTQTNLGRVKGEVDAGEQALSSAVTIMERIKVLAGQGKSGTANATARTSIADEIGSLLEQLGGIANTVYEGRHIFSGDSDQTAPYTIDLTQAPAVSAYAGSAATREILHPNGTRFSTSRTAQDIFDNADATKNIFFSVNSMRMALAANDQTAIDNAMDGLSSSYDHLNSQLSYYGTIQNKVAAANDAASTSVLQLKTHIAGLTEADTAESILDLQQAQLQQQAALKARGIAPRSTLFDYLG